MIYSTFAIRELRMNTRRDIITFVAQEFITIFGNSGDDPIGDDSIALLESIETTFEIQFTPDDDPIPRTVGELCNLVISRFEGSRTSKCTSSLIFYALRRAIRKVTVCKESISPSAKLAGLLSTKGGQRRKEWKGIEKSLALKLPELQFSNSIGFFLFLAHFAAVIAAMVFVLPSWRLDFGSWIGLILLIGFVALIFWLSTREKLQPLATGFPRNCETVGDLVKLILAKNYRTLKKRAGSWNEREAQSALRQFIADEVGIDPKTITPETSFPQGLNIF
jgi:hypothetical protein